MPTASELVYNRLVADEKLAAGTKYERLAALVYKVMDANAEVIHHVVLRATGKESDHEIDVAVSAGGEQKTLLIECRDRSRKVIKGEARDFFGKATPAQAGYRDPSELAGVHEGSHRVRERRRHSPW